MSVETAREKWGPLFAAMLTIVGGAIGLVAGEFWVPPARRSVKGIDARFLGGLSLVFGTVTLIGWIISVAGAAPASSDRVALKSKGVGRSRKRKPRPIDPNEEIAAKYLGLDIDGRDEEKGTEPPPIP